MLYDWMDEFIRKQMVDLSPPDFLQTWTKHCHLRKWLADQFDLGAASSGASSGTSSSSSSSGGAAPADMKLHGSIQITTMSMTGS
jgi:hypothetical protein